MPIITPPAATLESRRVRRLREQQELPVTVLPSPRAPRILSRRAVMAQQDPARTVAVPARVEAPGPETPAVREVPVVLKATAAPEVPAAREVPVAIETPVTLESPVTLETQVEIEPPVEQEVALKREVALAPPKPAVPAAPAAPVTPVAPPAPEKFRFDVGSIPLAPHSASLPIAAPIAPTEAGGDVVALTAAASVSLGRIVRRSFSVTLAAASVAGLLLTAAIPSLAPVDDEDRVQASAIQQLSLRQSEASSLSADVVEGVDGAEVAADAATIAADTYVNNPYGIVQYPFSRGVPLTDGFGYREAPIAQMHDGQDFAAGNGAAIRSIADGVVIEVGPTTDGCGTGVKIEHEVDGLAVASRYCHMQEDSTRVVVGEQVKVGQMIGRVGSTGMSFGAHLHLVIEVAGEAVDPMPFFEKYNAISR